MAGGESKVGVDELSVDEATHVRPSLIALDGGDEAVKDQAKRAQFLLATARFFAHVGAGIESDPRPIEVVVNDSETQNLLYDMQRRVASLLCGAHDEDYIEDFYARVADLSARVKEAGTADELVRIERNFRALLEVHIDCHEDNVVEDFWNDLKEQASSLLPGLLVGSVFGREKEGRADAAKIFALFPDLRDPRKYGRLIES